MKSAALTCLALLVLIPALALAQPAIRADNGIVNASSELPDVARGSWFVIFGTGLGPSSIVVQSAPPYPPTLSQTSVTFTPALGGSPISATMYYTWVTQVAGMLPSSAPAGAYDVRVTYNGQTSLPVRMNVVERNFGFATQTSNGQGPAQATYGGYDLNRFTTGTLAQWSLRPAHPGDMVVLWGTGLGADSASDLNGGTSGDQTAAAQVKVMVGGIAVTPVYAGRSGGSPGLDQINFTVPTNVTPTCFVSLQVSAGTRLSNLGSIAVAPTGQSACTSPAMTQAQLHQLDMGNTLTAGGLQAFHTHTDYTSSVSETSDTVSGWFGKYTVDAVANSNLAAVQPGVCFLVQRTGTIEQLGFGQPPTQTLDAGTRLTLSGPNAPNIGVPQQPDKSFYELLYSTGIRGVGATGSPTLTGGTYTLTGTGGADVGPFSASVTLPNSFTWTNESAVPNPIPRGTPLTVTWTGGEGGLVSVLGAALRRVVGSGDTETYNAQGFNCTAQASAGTFTVPTNVLQQMPAVSGDVTTTYFGLLMVLAVPDTSKQLGTFTAALTAGGNIDAGVFGYGIYYGKIIGYQ